MSLVQSKQLIPLSITLSDFQVTSATGRAYSLSDFTNAKGLVIAFMSNICPHVEAAWPDLMRLFYDFDASGIQFLAVNSHNTSLEAQESVEDMQKKIFELQIPFPYASDSSQELARKLSAACSPEIFLFDEKRQLYYHGRIKDTQAKSTSIQKEDLRNAIDALLVGAKSPPFQEPSEGCEIVYANV